MFIIACHNQYWNGFSFTKNKDQAHHFPTTAAAWKYADRYLEDYDDQLCVVPEEWFIDLLKKHKKQRK